jgi:uncharacterized protein with FMN-binding domain
MIQSMNKNLESLITAEINVIDLTVIDDGVYIGKYTALPVSVTLHVHVVNHEMTQIDIIEHLNGQGSEGEAIIDSIILTNSLQVDTIAGATYSSKVILLAVENALTNLKTIES